MSFVSPVRTSKSGMIMKAKKTAEYVQMPVEVKEMYADAGIVYAKRYFTVSYTHLRAHET